jgi:hypothetical protein
VRAGVSLRCPKASDVTLRFLAMNATALLPHASMSSAVVVIVNIVAPLLLMLITPESLSLIVLLAVMGYSIKRGGVLGVLFMAPVSLNKDLK